MEIVCEKCGSTNTFSDEEAAADAAGNRCRQCGELIGAAEQKPPAAAGRGEAGERREGPDGKKKAMIGERGEDSLLFDTKSLRKASEKNKPGPSVMDSGIVDVAQLLAAARLAQAEAPEPTGDDSALLGVKRPAVGPLSIPAEEAPKQESRGRNVYAILGAGALMAVAMLAAAWILKPGLQPIAGLAPGASPGQAETAGLAEAEPGERQAESAQGEQPQAATVATEQEEVKNEKERLGGGKRAPAPASSGRSEAKGSGPAVEAKAGVEPGPAGDTEAPAESETAGVATSATDPGPTDETAPRKPSEDNRSMESLLDNAVTGKALVGSAETEAAKAAAARAAGDLPKKPSRDQVLEALRRVQSKVSACAEGRKGTAMAAIKVGSNGRVKSVKVNGIEEPAASCIAGAVQQARFPEFSDPEFSVDFPFRL